MAKYGPGGLPLKEKLRVAWIMFRYHLKYADGVRLYGKYVGGWGGAMSSWRFEGKKDGEVVSRVEKRPGQKLHLEVLPSKTELTEGDGYDMAALRVLVKDDAGNIAPYAQLPILAGTEGPLTLACPPLVTAEGGMSGLYVRTAGAPGTAKVTLSAPGTDPVTVEFTIRA